LCWAVQLYCVGLYSYIVLGCMIILCWAVQLYCFGLYSYIVLGCTVILFWAVQLYCVGLHYYIHSFNYWKHNSEASPVNQLLLTSFLSVRIEQLGSHSTDFREIWVFYYFSKTYPENSSFINIGQE